MEDWIFDLESGDLGYTITITDHLTERYIEAPVREEEWTEVLKVFIDMLNGLGFIIDPVKAESVIQEISKRNIK